MSCAYFSLIFWNNACFNFKFSSFWTIIESKKVMLRQFSLFKLDVASQDGLYRDRSDLGRSY